MQNYDDALLSDYNIRASLYTLIHMLSFISYILTYVQMTLEVCLPQAIIYVHCIAGFHTLERIVHCTYLLYTLYPRML